MCVIVVMLDDPMHTFGRADELAEAMGLTPQMALQVAPILVFAANIEFRLEQAIWRVQGHSPKGVRHATDAKPIGSLIDMFERERHSLDDARDQQLVEDWCAAARVAFEYRHSIAHGVSLRFESTLLFARNRSWAGELRKRPAASLWGDHNTLENIRLTFAVLLRVINSVGNTRRPWHTVSNPEALKALRWARSLMEEMASGHGPWFEKY